MPHFITHGGTTLISTNSEQKVQLTVKSAPTMEYPKQHRDVSPTSLHIVHNI
jgi:hypothetical protein